MLYQLPKSGTAIVLEDAPLPARPAGSASLDGATSPGGSSTGPARVVMHVSSSHCGSKSIHDAKASISSCWMASSSSRCLLWKFKAAAIRAAIIARFHLCPGPMLFMGEVSVIAALSATEIPAAPSAAKGASSGTTTLSATGGPMLTAAVPASPSTADVPTAFSASRAPALSASPVPAAPSAAEPAAAAVVPAGSSAAKLPLPPCCVPSGWLTCSAGEPAGCVAPAALAGLRRACPCRASGSL
mmetsp:Transcript_64824/g.163275  ORF Transcript_64824/g.163275 Transcript_64824/m.163275 type:complete len:243 (+) Transcript_64824:119-847(+)